MTRIVFVINPASGISKDDAFPAKVQDFCRRSSHVYELIYTSGENDFDLIQSTLQNYKPHIVVACGGDGTVNLIASVLQKTKLHKDIKLAIIPMGSSNGLAYNLNIPTDAEAALELIDAGVEQPVEIVLINKRHLCLHLSDIGFNALLIKHSEEGNYRGKLKYLINFFRTIVKNKVFKVDICGENFRRKIKAEMVVLANAQKYATGAIINPNGKFGDGNFEVCVVRPYRWWQLFILSLKLLKGTAQSTEMLNVHSLTNATLKLAKPQLLQVDGELIGKVSEVAAEVLPERLILIAGSGENF